ncbi:MAG: LEA type 2 family protein [Steroidobacteraceae bacterium]
MKSAVALLLTLGLAGCAGLGTKLETPHVAFVGLRTVDANLFEQKLEVRLRVQNPNEIELPVNGLSVDVELAGEPFAHGVSAREFTVPANGEAEFDMNVTANAATALMRILSGDRNSRDDVEYRLKGKLSTRLGMLRSIPFNETGTLPIGSITEKKGKKAD